MSGLLAGRDDLPLLRVVVALGATRLLRFFVLVVFLGATLQVIVLYRPDLADPADLTSDTSTYRSAGQRLNGGSPLYQLMPGDRPAPEDDPPYWSTPMLSPPPIAALWRPLALGPGPFVMELWWLGGVFATGAASLWLISRLPAPGLLLMVALAYPLTAMALSGNLNAYLLPAMMAVWPLSMSSAPRARVLAGGVVAVAGAMKVTPLLLVAWFLVRRDRPAIAGFVAIGLAVTTATLVLAGMDSIADFMGIARSTAVEGATPASPTGILLDWGVPAAVARAGPLLVGGASIAAGWVLRDRPRVSFAAIAAGAVLATPVVRADTLGLLAVCLAPWATPAPSEAPTTAAPMDDRPRFQGRTRRVGLAALALLVGLATVRASTVPTSSAWLRNDTSSPAIVRFQAVWGTASFGFSVPPRSSGWAWRDQPGSLWAIAIVYGSGCEMLVATELDSHEVTVAIEASAISVTPGVDASMPASSAPFLAYDHDCAGR